MFFEHVLKKMDPPKFTKGDYLSASINCSPMSFFDFRSVLERAFFSSSVRGNRHFSTKMEARSFLCREKRSITLDIAVHAGSFSGELEVR